jgi:hypothetical protein
MRPSLVIVVLAALLLATSVPSCASRQPEVTLRGQLLSDPQFRWYLTPCDRKYMYLVRILASNPWAHFADRIDKLASASPGAPMIAELKGRLDSEVPPDGRLRQVQGVLTVSEVVVLDLGTCPSSTTGQSGRGQTSNYCVQLTAGRLVGAIATAALARRS